MGDNIRTKPWAIGLVLFSTILISFAQIFFKKASGTFTFDIISLILNWQLILGFVLYGLAAIILIFALRDGELSVLYPVLGMSYVWVSLLSMFLLQEAMNLSKWSGVFIVIVGVSCIGYGSRGEE